jgi:hypothetical protein
MGPTKKSIEANNKKKLAAKADKMMAETAKYAAAKKAAPKKTPTKLGAAPKTKRSERGNIFEAVRSRKDIALKY